LAQEKRSTAINREKVQDLEQIKKRLDLLDNRLDSIDSVITAVVERVMSQPIAITVTCPSCGKNVEFAILGSSKPVK